MTAIDKLLYLNGVPLAWNSTRSTINGLFPMLGFTEINLEESREGEYVYAQQPDGRPLGITSGEYKVDSFSFKMLAASAELLYETLAISFGPSGAALGSFGDARFSYQLSIFEPGAPVAGPALTLNVNGIKIEKRKIGASRGAGGLEWEHECKATSAETIGAGPGLSGLLSRLYSLQRALT